MATKSKYEAVPPLSTIKNLDPSLKNVLRPIRNYVNALIGGTGAQLPVKVELQAEDIPSGFIVERILGDASIVTRKVVDDNITRMWTYHTITPISIPEYSTDSETYKGVVIAYTSPFVPDIEREIMFWGYIEFYFYEISVGDIIHFITYIFEAIDVVMNGVCKWTLSDQGTSEYFLTNMAGTSAPFDFTVSAVDIVLTNAANGGGTKLNKIAAHAALTAGTYDFDDRETPSLGFDTLYVRLSDSSDPNSKPDGYLRAGNYLRTFYSPYFTGYMDYGLTGQINQPLQFSVQSTNTYRKSYVVLAIEQDCVGSLGSRYCIAQQIDFKALERKK